MLKNIINRNLIINFSNGNNINANSIKLILNNNAKKKILKNNHVFHNQFRNYTLNRPNRNISSNFEFTIQNEKLSNLKLSSSINNFTFKTAIKKYFHTEGTTSKKYNDVQEDLKPKLETVPFQISNNEAKKVNCLL